MSIQTSEKQSVFSYLVLSLLVIILFTLLYYAFQPDTEKIRLRFLDVGQGDAALITTPANQNILIDGGPNDSVVEKLDRYLPFYRRSIDVIILSHPHADHLDGLLEVIDRFEVKSIYMTGVLHTTPEYIEFLEKIKSKQIETKIVISGDQIDFGNDIIIDFLYPFSNFTGQKVDNLNNSSIVNKLSWGEEDVLFTGDLESEIQTELVKKQMDLGAEILKVPHHGSKDSANEDFLTFVKPKYAVISAGKDNKFGHPSQEMLSLLKGVTVFRTDYDGDVTFEMTKTSIWPNK